MIVLTIHMTINLAVLPLFSINVAHNRVRIPGILTFFMGFGNLALAIALPLLTGWGYYGIAIAGAIVLTLKNALFTPWYATRVLKINSHAFTRSMLPGVVATALIIAAAIMLGMILPLGTLMVLMLAGLIITAAYVVMVWRVGLNSDERELFKSYVPEKLRRNPI